MNMLPRSNTKIERPNCHTSNLSQIQHESLRITVIQRLEQLLQISDKAKMKPVEETSESSGKPVTPVSEVDEAEKWDPSAEDDSQEIKYDPFGDLYKQRFLWYYDAYLRTINQASETTKDGKAFPNAMFEYGSNAMKGKYAYKELYARLQRVRKALDDEVAAWAVQGLESVHEERGIATNLRRQFEQHSEYLRQSALPVELTLVNKNPFVWNLTFFGKAETDLYGATINVRINFSTNFPQEQPRVNVLTPLYHHRISKTGGVLCYFSARPESVRDHIEAIMAAIEEEHPTYDPRTLVNPEAAALLWGKEDERKLYRRKLRRSVQDSMENMDEF